MHNHSPTSLLREILKPISRLHMLHTEVTAIILEVLTVHCEQLTEHLTLNLIHKIVDCIPIDKTSFFGIVCMQIEIKSQPMVLVEMLSEMLYSVDCRMFLRVRVYVMSVEIVAVGVHSEVAVVHSIDVDHRDDHKYKHLSE